MRKRGIAGTVFFWTFRKSAGPVDERCTLATPRFESVNKLLTAFEKLGIRRVPSSTLQELSQVAISQLGEVAKPLVEHVPLYNAARFGGTPFTETDEARLCRLAEALLRATRTPVRN
jgi:hypothetical protein